VVLGGPTAWKSWTMHGFLVAFHWINDTPSVCLASAQKKIGRPTVVIPFDVNLHRFAESTFVWDKAAAYLPFMGMDTSRKTIYNLCEVILKAIDDLVHMPPSPIVGTREIGDVEVVIDGKTIGHHELKH
jgi:hypothetical protein